MTPTRLGNNGSFCTHGDGQQLTDEVLVAQFEQKTTRDALRFGARAHGRDLLHALGIENAVSFCGAGLQYGKRSCSVVRRMDDSIGSVRGLCACGSAMVCPVCGPRIASKRATQVVAVEQWHRERGGMAHLITLTMPHKAGEFLASMVGDFNRAREIAFAGRYGVYLRELRVGFVAGHECNYSDRTGWHFHRHEAVFGAYGPREYGFMHDRWMAGLKAVDRYTRGCEEHAFDARVAKDGASYAAKIGFEVAFAPAKETRSLASLIVEDFVRPMSSGMAWVDGAMGVKGVNSVRSSRGLYAAAGVVETTDAEDAADAYEAGDEILGDLSAAQYYRVLLRKKEFELRMAAQEGRKSVNSLLHSIGAGSLQNTAEAKPALLAGTLIGQQGTLCYSSKAQ